VQAEIEVSVVSLNRELRTVVAGSAQSLEKFNTSRAVGGRVRESCAKSLRESELTKLRRDSSFVDTVGTDPGEAQAGRSCGAEEILKGENQRPGFDA
jgi:malonyl CoA-acyl carrier protein transacylase